MVAAAATSSEEFFKVLDVCDDYTRKTGSINSKF